MSNSVDGLSVTMRALLEHPKLMARSDPSVVPLQWDELAMLRARRGLRIGWYLHYGQAGEIGFSGKITGIAVMICLSRLLE